MIKTKILKSALAIGGTITFLFLGYTVIKKTYRKSKKKSDLNLNQHLSREFLDYAEQIR
jgi:arginine exporter protein ArgO